MRCKPILLGGAMVLALSVGAAAQQTAPGTDQTNTNQPGTQAPADQTSQTSTATSKSTSMHHHYRHHIRHSTKTASMHGPSTPAEKRETLDLNRQQLMTAQGAGGAQGATQPGNASYSQPMGAQGSQPGNASYSQPAGTSQTSQPQSSGEPGTSYMSAPGANGPVGAQGNPTTSTDQKAPDQNAQPANPNPPGPSS